jgi:hypothetical protein
MGTPAEESLKPKAIDILVESIKLCFTLSTVSIAGLLGYIGSIGKGVFGGFAITALSLFLLTCILSVFNINTIINKVHRCNSETIMHPEVKFVYSAISLLLLSGLVFSGLYISSQRSMPNSTRPTAPESVTVTDDSIVIPNNFKTGIVITKDNNKIIKVSITEKAP